MSLKILLEKNKERETGVSEENERRRRKEKSNGCTSSFYVDFCLRESSIFAVTVFKNPSLIYIFLTLVPNRNLI